MTTTHIHNLKKRVGREFESALIHFHTLDLNIDDGSYNGYINEFEAGSVMLGDLVTDDDTFSSRGAYLAVRQALVTFFEYLDEHALRRLRVAVLLDEIDAAVVEPEGMA